MRCGFAAILIAGLLPGCVVVQVGASNPIPGLTTVAVAPFFNLSQEPTQVADGRRLALAYYAELQKTPGFQVIPVGVVEDAVRANGLLLNDPDDALRLCRILGCDAVAVGAITDYDPYYPPRLGVQVSWYSPYPWVFEPGIPIDPNARAAIRQADIDAAREAARRRAEARRAERESKKESKKKCGKSCDSKSKDPCPPGVPAAPAAEMPGEPPPVFRGQSETRPRVYSNTEIDLENLPDGEPPAPPRIRWDPKVRNIVEDRDAGPPFEDSDRAGGESEIRRVSSPFVRPGSAASDRVSQGTPPNQGRSMTPSPRSSAVTSRSPETPKRLAQDPALPGLSAPLGASPDGVPPLPPAFDPRQPLMSYTRLFDGTDAALVATLRDYLELGGNQRTGTWEASLHRSEDFMRFCSHLMVVEMLTLHGGESRTRLVFKMRRYH